MRHFIRPVARDDIVRQFRYYLLVAEAPEAGLRFVDAVDETIRAICATPLVGAPKQLRNPILSGLRSWAVKGFKGILVFYVVEPDCVRIVRVLHGRRDIKKILEREKDDEVH